MTEIKKDCDKYKIIISCDGGGTRGFFTVNAIENLFVKSNCDIFKHSHLIGGTSTGGIISLAKGTRNFPNKDLAGTYQKETSEAIFKCHPLRVFKKGELCNSEVLYDTVDKLLKDHNVLEGGSKDCFVVSVTPHNAPEDPDKSQGKFKPVIISNYKQKEYPDDLITDDFKEYKHPHRYLIEDDVGKEKMNTPNTILCTAGIPSLFKLFQVDGKEFYDGGVLFNNPVGFAYLEARNKYPDHKLIILSFGTGCFGENKTELLKINDDTNLRLSKDLNAPIPKGQKEFFKWCDSVITSLKLLIKGTPDSYAIFKEIKKSAELDKKAFFYRIDNVIPENISFHDTSLESLKLLKTCADDLNKSLQFALCAESIRRAILKNGVPENECVYEKSEITFQ